MSQGDRGAADDHLRETTHQSEDAWEGRFMRVQCDVARLPDGRLAPREFVRHPGAVMVVPLLDDGRVIVERQWRYPLQRSFIEFPAGKIDQGEDPWICGMRELTEETGYVARHWARAGLMHNAIGYSDERIEIWFARNLVAGPQALDEGELLDVLAVHPDELMAQVAGGELTDAKTIVGLMWLQQWRAGRWTLDWQPAPAGGPAA